MKIGVFIILIIAVLLLISYSPKSNNKILSNVIADNQDCPTTQTDTLTFQYQNTPAEFKIEQGTDGLGKLTKQFLSPENQVPYDREISYSQIETSTDTCKYYYFQFSQDSNSPTVYYGFKAQKDSCNNYQITVDNDGKPLTLEEINTNAQQCNPNKNTIKKQKLLTREAECTADSKTNSCSISIYHVEPDIEGQYRIQVKEGSNVLVTAEQFQDEVTVTLKGVGTHYLLVGDLYKGELGNTDTLTVIVRAPGSLTQPSNQAGKCSGGYSQGQTKCFGTSSSICIKEVDLIHSGQYVYNWKDTGESIACGAPPKFGCTGPQQQTTTQPSAICGDGKKEGSEICDGQDLGSITNECKDYNGDGKKYLSGNLQCNQCAIDTSTCKECPKEQIVTSPDFPGKRLINLGKLEFEIQKRDHGGLSGEWRGGRTRTETERFFSIDDCKIVGKLTTTIINEYDGSFSRDTVRESIGKGVASALEKVLAGHISNDDLTLISNEVKQRIGAEGSSITSIIDGNKIKATIGGSQLNEITILTDQEALLLKPAPLSEILDAKLDTSDPLEEIWLVIMNGNTELEAKKIDMDGCITVSCEKQKWENQKGGIEDLYKRWISDPTNQNSRAYFDKIKSNSKDDKTCFCKP
ncbi:MAG: hypothetical protein Q7S74_03405 [Nanoarchaeota archaeon]|nr:hypothetical protein [Nanoarchaeota archaeon]